MLPSSVDQYSAAFAHIPTPNMVDHQHHHLDAQQLATSPLDQLAHPSQYPPPLSYHPNRHVLPNGKAFLKPHRLPYPSGPIAPRTQRDALHERSGRGSATSGPVRRRISRACDQCNQLRTKCDGRQSCAHCIEFGLTCEYIRERKKRGKASRKDLAQQQSAATETKKEEPSDVNAARSPDAKAADSTEQSSPKPVDGQAPSPSRSATKTEVMPRPILKTRTTSMSVIDTPQKHETPNMQSMQSTQTPQHQIQGQSLSSVPDYAPMDSHRNSAYQSSHRMIQPGMHPIVPSHGLDYSDSPYSIMSPQSAHAQVPSNPFGIQEESTEISYMSQSPVASSPEWGIPSPYPIMFPGVPHQNPSQQLRYPVLQPLVPHLANLMPISLACDLLELYFQSSSPVFMQPVSPYVLGHVFRKNSFLRHNNPRVCSPALLASILWISCLTSESPYLSSSPSMRTQLSEKLMNLTISLLKPLVHQAAGGSDARVPRFSNNGMVNGVIMGSFGMATQDTELGLRESPAKSEYLTFRPLTSLLAGVSGAIDDVATYMNLAIVISASEYKSASLRWWNTAWSLAKELRLGQEVPVTPPPEPNHEEDLQSFMNTTEEQREERRRIWWLLYAVDRHLALCYNQPLSLLDVECSGLLQPLDDNVWQNGQFFEDSAQVFSDSISRRKGPLHECTGLSVFGFFLPCMTILGDIFSLRYVQSHPRLGPTSDWHDHASVISQQLLQFERSLQEIRNRALNEVNAGSHEPGLPGVPFDRSTNVNMSRARDLLKHATIAEAYGRYIMHTLQVLLNGRWDPICLLEDRDYWTSSHDFVVATGHAASAADALSTILEYDPGLGFMPFFFGIYLLQGSFLFLLIASKLQGLANASIAHACHVFARAHEVCNTTVNAEYQRNFQKIIQSALQRIRGQDMDTFIMMQQRYREMLSIYRWTGDGTGIAL